MKNIIIGMSELMQLETEKHDQKQYIQLICFIQFVQHLALILPSASFSYINMDAYYQVFFKFICIFLGDLTQYFAVVLLIVLMNLAILLIVILKNNLQNGELKTLKFNIYRYLILIQSVLFMPQLFYLQYLLFSFQTNTEFVIFWKILGSIILILLRSVSHYFLRNTYCLFKSQLREWSRQIFIGIILEIVLISIQSNRFQLGQQIDLIKYVFFVLFLFNEFTDLLFCQPYFPYENALRFRFVFMNTFNLLLFVIFYFNNGLFNRLQFPPILILNSLTFYLGDIVAKKVQIGHIFSSKINRMQQIKFLTELNYHQNYYSQFLSLYIIRKHNKQCLLKCECNDLQQMIDCLSENSALISDQMQLYEIYRKTQNVSQILYCFMKVQKISANLQNRSLFFQQRVQQLRMRVKQKIMSHFYENQNEFEKQERKILASQFLYYFTQESLLVEMILKIIAVKLDTFKYCFLDAIEAQEFQKQVLKLSKQIENLQTLIEKILNKPVTQINVYSIYNLLHLKMLQQYFIHGVKDIISIIITEKQIQTVLAIERFQNLEELSFPAYIEDRITVISVKLLQNMGQITKTNFKHLNLFFSVNNKQEYFKNINQFIPSFLLNIHKELLEEFHTTAESTFFTQFRTLMATNLDGFLLYVKVQFTIDFSVLDDLVLQITMQKPLKIIDTILFDEEGKILGITELLYNVLFQQQDCEYTLGSLLSHGKIYIFIPDIFEILKRKFKSKQKINLNYNFIEQADFFPVTFAELSRYSQNPSFSYMENVSQKKNAVEKALRSKQKRRLSILLNDDFADHIRVKINRQHNNSGIKIKFQIDSKVLKTSKQSLTYYSMTIYDVKFELGKGRSWNSSFFNSQFSQSISSDQINPESDVLEEQKIYRLTELASQVHCPSQSNQIPLQGDQSYEKSDRITKNISLSQIQPFTHRPEFDKPLVQNHQEAEIGQFSLNSSFKQNSEKQISSQENFHENDQFSNIFEVRSSIDKDYRSQQLGALQSFKNFTNTKKTNNSLKILSFLNIIIVVLIASFIFESLIYCQKMNDSAIQNIYYVHAPLSCNRYFSKVASLNWLLVLQVLGQVNKSELLINKALQEMEILRSKMTDDMRDTTSLFIQMELKGLTQELTIDLLFVRNVTSNITQFIDVLQLFAAQIFRTENLTFSHLTPTLNLKVLTSMFIIRYNFKNFYYANDQLLTELADMFHIQIENSSSNLLSILVINVILITILLFLQLSFQIKNKNHNKRILFLLTCCTENDIREEYNMLNIVKQSFIEEGKNNWKKQGYFEFEQLNEKNHFNFEKQKSCFMQRQQQKLRSANQNIKRDLKIKEKVNTASLNNKNVISQFLLSLIFLLLFQTSGYVFYDYSKQKLYPLQNSTNNFVRFSAQIDLLIACLQIIKTQPLLFQGLIDHGIYTNKSIQAIRDGRKVFKIFYQIMDNFSAKLQDQFSEIIDLNLDFQDQEQLEKLYQDNLCESLYNEFYQCQQKNLTETKFSELYGSPKADDNNLEYISQGIQGIVTRLQQFVYENYDFELQTPDYLPNNTQLSLFSQSQLFNALVFSHFTFTYQAILKFLNILIQNFENTISSLTRNLLIYYLIGGIFSLMVLSIFNYFYYKTAIKTLNRLRLGLSIMPKHYQIDSSILQMIKRLDNE